MPAPTTARSHAPAGPRWVPVFEGRKWERTSIWRSCTRRSSRTCSASCFACAHGSSATWLPSTAPRAPRVLTRPVVSATRCAPVWFWCCACVLTRSDRQAKQGYVIYRVRVKRGGRKKPVSKGIIYGKPKFQGVKHLKNQVNLRNIAEVRLSCFDSTSFGSLALVCSNVLVA